MTHPDMSVSAANIIKASLTWYRIRHGEGTWRKLARRTRKKEYALAECYMGTACQLFQPYLQRALRLYLPVLAAWRQSVVLQNEHKIVRNPCAKLDGAKEPKIPNLVWTMTLTFLMTFPLPTTFPLPMMFLPPTMFLAPPTTFLAPPTMFLAPPTTFLAPPTMFLAPPT
ncbi:hypothetical protein EDB19DRAFT_2046711, partial [Suillus lakei]